MFSDVSEVTGVDISQVACDTANEIAKELDVENFKAVRLDFAKSNVGDKYDFVLLVNVLHHTDCPEDLLNNAHACLNDDGFLIIFENNPVNPLFIPFFIMIGAFKAHANIQYFKSNRFYLSKIINRTGFEVDRIIRYGYLPTVLYNYSLAFKKFNELINKIPLVNEFCAFHILKCSKHK